MQEDSHNAPVNAAGYAGIRPRGADAHRLETFVDAAFAFALTLLVISFDEVPGSYDELLQALRGAPAFLASFAIIVMVWFAHHRWSRDFGLSDPPSVLISLLLVFVVMVYVYPLRAMMSTAMNQITGGWAPSNFAIESVDEVRGLFTIYGAGFTATTACIGLLYLRALRSAEKLALTPYEKALTSVDVIAWAIVSGMGVVSIVLAATLPDHLLAIAGWVYSALGILVPLITTSLMRRARRRLDAE